MTLKNFLHTIIGKIHREKVTVISASHEARALFHWKIIVISFLSAVIVIFITSFLIYGDISKEKFLPEVKDGGDLVPVVTEFLNTAVSQFETKSAMFDKLKKNRTFSV